MSIDEVQTILEEVQNREIVPVMSFNAFVEGDVLRGIDDGWVSSIGTGLHRGRQHGANPTLLQQLDVLSAHEIANVQAAHSRGLGEYAGDILDDWEVGLFLEVGFGGRLGWLGAGMHININGKSV